MNLARPALRVALAISLASALAACSTLETTANVAKAGASVVGSTVSTSASVVSATADIGLKTASTAASVGSAAITTGSAAVSAGAAARTAAAATGAVVVAGATAVGSAVKWGVELSRSNELEYASVRAESANQFVSKEGARIATRGCDDAQANEPALLVTQRSGEFNVRMLGAESNAASRECKVLTINDQSIPQ